MTVTIPNKQTKKWSQLNQGDLLGTLYATRNIDLETPGILKLAQRTRYVGRGTSGLLDCMSIVYGNFNSTFYQYWIVSSSGGVYTLNQDLSGFAVDGLSNTPSTHSGSDGCMWNGSLFVSKTARIAKLTAGTWTTDWSSADFTTTTSGVMHPVEPNVTNLNLLVGDVNLLKSCASDGTISTALTLPSNYDIVWIRRGTNVNYIGLDSRLNGGTGAVAVWDGLSTTLEANALIPIKAKTPLSGVVDERGILHIIQSDGRLMRFNGTGFEYVSELPPYRDYNIRVNWGGSLSIFAKVFPRGMAIVRGKIHIAVDATSNIKTRFQSNTTAIAPNFHGGVWVYDDDNKAFYHKGSLSYSNTITDFGASMAQNSCSAISPVYEDKQNASAPAVTVGGKYLVGSRLYADTTSTVYRAICSATTGENRGQATTCRIESNDITDTNISVWCKYQGLNTSTDRIVFKYRTSFREAITGISITWTSTTTFTSTDSVLSNVAVGDEITVLFGNGSGGTAHITNISLVTTTYTITIDEAITGISTNNESWILIDNWKRFPTDITYLDTAGYKQLSFPIQADTPWVQLKVELRGEGSVVGIQELKVVTKANQKAI